MNVYLAAFGIAKSSAANKHTYTYIHTYMYIQYTVSVEILIFTDFEGA